MAASATFALKAGVWVRRVRFVIVSPDSTGTACPLSGRNSTYRPVQISGAGSQHLGHEQNSLGTAHAKGIDEAGIVRDRQAISERPGNRHTELRGRRSDS
jgi:hypothetical protein